MLFDAESKSVTKMFVLHAQKHVDPWPENTLTETA